ncbi:PAQR family membrane homeostasis protein TrhA [Caryophanon tenue]|uniref:Hemolysin D n=1 Tax=Caryophanon tenue TaxID=33978 RepID=A0A1C0YE45_9BACL|nr:hemolysin III family protein [Caryophanon tenue]OCS85421.1 hemolysin D [Caryophanon tenue]
MAQLATMNIHYSKREEMWNAITHGAGFVLAIPATIALAMKAQTTLELSSYLLFGIAMMILYLSSTLYHALPVYKDFFKKLDHGAIFLLIAGTYAPIALVAVGGTLGWTILMIELALAAIGIVLKFYFVHRFKKASLIVYIGMGWLIIFAYQPLLAQIGYEGFLWLLIGGLFYTAGTYFYRGEHIPYNHAIWHLFVLAGSACMYVCVYLYL